MKMEPLSIEVASLEETAVCATSDKTQCLLRVHTDECTCGTDAETTASFGMKPIIFFLRDRLL